MLLVLSACDPQCDESLTDLAREVISNERPFGPRLSGSDRHRPCIPTDSTSEIGIFRCRDGISSKALERAVELASRLRSAASDTTRDARIARVLLDLMTDRGDATTQDRVAASFEELLIGPELDAELLNDAGVALLVRAGTRGTALDLIRGLDLLERAARLDATSTTACFNRALAREAVGLVATAVEAWRWCARLDSIAGWASEIETHITRLDAKLAGPPPVDAQTRRELVVDSLLPAWGVLVATGRPDLATLVLRRARQIADTLASSHGDSTAIDGVRAVELLPLRADDPGVQGLAAYHEGRARFTSGDFLEARVAFVRAEQLLAAEDMALRGWAINMRAAVDVYRNDFRRAEAGYKAVIAHPLAAKHASLTARAWWGLGLSQGRQARLQASQDAYLTAARLFTAAREPRNQAIVEYQVAELLNTIGFNERASALGRHSLFDLHLERESAHLHTLLLILGSFALEGSPNAAVAIQKEAVIVASRTGRTKDLPEALARLSAAELASGHHEAALRLVAQARVELEGVKDPLMRDRISADLILVEARSSTSPTRFDSVAAYFERSRVSFSLAPVLVERSVARLAIGDTIGAERDVRVVLGLAERQTKDVLDPASRNALLEARRGAFRTAIAIAVARQDTAVAWDMVRRSHGISGFPPWPHLLTWTILPDRIVTWFWKRGKLMSGSVPITASEVRNLVERFVNAVRTGSSVEEDLSRALWDGLVGPVFAGFSDGEELALLLEPELEPLPFAALRGLDGEYLIERRPLLVVRPASRGPHRRLQGVKGILLVNGASFDRNRFPELSLLPGADAEIEAVRAVHPVATGLAGPRATRTALVAGLHTASVFHFAGHARSLAGSIARSHLVLSPSDDGDLLFGEDLRGLDLSGLKLVVLSACSTIQRSGAEPGRGSGLSEAFLEAGAGAVIGTLWEANDRVMPDLMAEIHRQIARGATAAEALRQAQLQVLKGSRKDRFHTWAMLRAEGSGKIRPSDRQTR